VYINDDHGPPFSVVWYNNQWYECQHDRRTREPYLGRIRREVSEGDVPTTTGEDTPDEAEQSERPEESEDEPTSQEIRRAPAVIDPSGPGSPYHQGREPWTPIAPPRQHSSPLNPHPSTSKGVMGTTTTATHTTIAPGLTSTTTAPSAPTGPTPAISTPSTAAPDAGEQLRVALAATLR
jgi:hypothetical protein